MKASPNLLVTFILLSVSFIACSSRDDRLLQHAADTNPDVRREAIRNLSTVASEGNVRAQEAILASLDDTSRDVRVVAVAVAKLAADHKDAWIRTVRSIDAVARRLNDDDDHVKRDAAGVLGAIKDPRSLEPLLDCLGDGSPPGQVTPSGPAVWAGRQQQQEVLHACARALGELKDARALELLLKLMADPDPELRAEAAEGLGKIGDSRALWPLIGVLDWDGDLRSKGAVMAAIDKMNEPLRAAAASGDLPVVAKAYRYFLFSRSPATTVLADALQSRYGTMAMADDFLASNDPLLEKAVREWARGCPAGC